MPPSAPRLRGRHAWLDKGSARKAPWRFRQSAGDRAKCDFGKAPTWRRDVFPIGDADRVWLPARRRVRRQALWTPPANHVAMLAADGVGSRPSQRRSETGDGSPQPVTEKISDAPRAIG